VTAAGLIGGQPGQQPEPAPAERDRDHHDRRDQAGRLHQTDDDPAGHTETAGYGCGWAEVTVAGGRQ